MRLSFARKPLLIALWLAAAGLVSPAAHASDESPITLTITLADGNSGDIPLQTADDVRKAIEPCLARARCEEISVETCDRCVIYATRARGGFHIHSRLGPPGPLYELLDKRPGRKGRTLFNLRDVTSIFIDYLFGSETIPVDYRDTGDI